MNARTEVQTMLLAEGEYQLTDIDKAIEYMLQPSVELFNSQLPQLKQRARDRGQALTKEHTFALHVKILLKKTREELKRVKDTGQDIVMPGPGKGSTRIPSGPVGTPFQPPTARGEGIAAAPIFDGRLLSAVIPGEVRKHRTFQISSANRDHRAFAHTDNIGIAFTSENKPTGFWRIELLEVYVPQAYIFLQRPQGTDFYIRLTDLPFDHVQQTDGHQSIGHFKCRVKLDGMSEVDETTILNSDIVLDAPKTLSGILGITFLDEHKQALKMPHDIYPIESVRQVGAPNFKTRFTVADHALSSGEPVLVAGLTVQGDSQFFDSSHMFKVIARSPTEIDIDAYRATPTPVYVSDNPRLIIPTHSIKLSLRFTFTGAT